MVIDPVMSRRGEVNDLSASGDYRDGPRQSARLNFAIDELGDSGESCTGKTNGFRIEVVWLGRLHCCD